MKFKKGDRVLVKDKEGTEWQPAVFVHEVDGLRYGFFVETMIHGEKVNIPFEQCKLETPYAERQAKWLRDNKLILGSKVLVARTFGRREDGSDCEGIDSFSGKADSVGKELFIKEIQENHLMLWYAMDGTISGNYYPYTALEPVTERPTEEVATDPAKIIEALATIGIHTKNITVTMNLDSVPTIEFYGYLKGTK